MTRAVHCLPLLLLGCAAPGPAWRHFDFKVFHLGTAGRPEWQEFADDPPDGTELSLSFASDANTTERTLLLWQDNVKFAWTVSLNGRKLGQLQLYEVPVITPFAVSPGALRDGKNTLTITPPSEVEDIRVGLMRIERRPIAELAGGSSLEVAVTESPAGRGVPSRITIVDEYHAALPPLAAAPGQRLAVRPGCVYTGDGRARVALQPGRYRIHAGRGFEYSIATRHVEVAPGEARKVALEIRREVPTPGLVACDTHMHTLEVSGHGDASVEERVLTLAGEGLELPVATEHNQHASYAEAAEKSGLRGWLTPVPGCEVTTPAGHFNIFPVVPGGPVADAKETDWPKLMRSLRAVPGVRVIVLNHPRNKHSDFVPFAGAHFNAATGDNRRGPEFTFDALEVTNSSALRVDDFQVFRDWFALLNHGYRVTAVASSDSHEVNRFIVGQGRTYIACPDSDPGKIDVEAACRALLDGRAATSLGLLAWMTVGGRNGPGDLVAGRGDLDVEVSVLGPSWVQAEKLALFANGVKIREERLRGAQGGEKARIRWRLPRSPYDFYLVAIASGPGVRDLAWPLSRPYQPERPVWEPRVIGATNPIRVDGDGDGAWTSPRAQAARIVESHLDDPEALVDALAARDEAIAAQAASLLQARGKDVRVEPYASAPGAVGRGFAAFASAIR